MTLWKIVSTRYQLNLILGLREQLAAKLRTQSTVIHLFPALTLTCFCLSNNNISVSLPVFELVSDNWSGTLTGLKT